MPSVARIAQKSFLKIHNTWELPGTSLPWPVVFKAVLRPPAFCPPPLKKIFDPPLDSVPIQKDLKHHLLSNLVDSRVLVKHFVLIVLKSCPSDFYLRVI